MRFLLPLLTGLLLIFVACPPVVTLDTPVVETEALASDNGGTLRLSWTAITDASGYNIYYDGSTTKATSVTGTQFDVTEPHTKIEVTAYNGDEESEKALVDATPVTTSSVVVYFTSDPSNTNHAIKFATDGTCIPTTLGSDIEFVMEDVEQYQGTTIPGFWSPDMYPTPYNAHDNGIAPSAGTDFNALTAAVPPGTYLTRMAITENAVYPLWVDPEGTGWSETDNFANAYIQSIDGTTVTMKVAYQKIGGLRWLVTE